MSVDLGRLTVIVGQNDLGKSAIFRAIRAASEAMAGDAFITYGAMQTQVALAFDGNILVWEKGAKVNRYILQTPPDGKKQIFEKIGRQTPSEVAELLGMGKVAFDKDLDFNLNFADQDDPPFLIPFPGGMSPSHVAKVLGDLTNLNLLYRAVGEADARRRRSEQMLKIRRQDLKAKTEALTYYDDLPVLEQKVTKARQLVASAHFLQGKIEQLKRLQFKKQQMMADHVKLQAVLHSLPPDMSPQLKRVEELESQLNGIEGLRDRFNNAILQASMSRKGFERAREDAQSAQAELNRMMLDLEVCPLCDQPMSKVHVHA